MEGVGVVGCDVVAAGIRPVAAERGAQRLMGRQAEAMSGRDCRAEAVSGRGCRARVERGALYGKERAAGKEFELLQRCLRASSHENSRVGAEEGGGRGGGVAEDLRRDA